MWCWEWRGGRRKRKPNGAERSGFRNAFRKLKLTEGGVGENCMGSADALYREEEARPDEPWAWARNKYFFIFRAFIIYYYYFPILLLSNNHCAFFNFFAPSESSSDSVRERRRVAALPCEGGTIMRSAYFS